MVYDKIKVINLTKKKYIKLCDKLSYWNYFDNYNMLKIPSQHDTHKKTVIFEVTQRDECLKELTELGFECCSEEWVYYTKKCSRCNGTGTETLKK